MTEKQKRILHTVAIVSDTARSLTADPYALMTLDHAIEQVMAIAKIEAENHAKEHEESGNAKDSN